MNVVFLSPVDYSDVHLLAKGVDMTTKTKKMSDKKALDEITEILRSPEWDADTLTYVADVVRATGRDFSTNPWTPNADGDIVCVDCEEAFEKQDILGDPQWSDPRCLDCYEAHRYER